MLDKEECNNNNNNNNNKERDLFNYKGYFIEYGREEKKFYEFGAHFPYKDLCLALIKLKLEKEKTEKFMRIKPQKKLIIERYNQKENKIQENINNIIKEFKIKNRSRNILQQENKEASKRNLNNLTYIPLNIDKNRNNKNNNNNSKNKSIFNFMNNTNYNYNSLHINKTGKQILLNIENKLKQLDNKYNYTINNGKKYSIDLPLFLTDNSLNIQNENNTMDDLKNLDYYSINRINIDHNLFKYYQPKVKKIDKIKIKDELKDSIIKNNLLNDKINISKNKRILSSNFNKYFQYNYKYTKNIFSPLGNIKTKKKTFSGDKYFTNKYNNISKINRSNINNNLNEKKMLDIFNQQQNYTNNNINSFSLENNRKYTSNSYNIGKSHYFKNRISNISSVSQNKNMPYQNIYNNLHQRKKPLNKNIYMKLIRKENLSIGGESNQKNKIQNLFKLLNKHEKISRNNEINSFLNYGSLLHNTNQFNTSNMRDNNIKTKSIFTKLNNGLRNKEKVRVKLNNLLKNKTNIINNDDIKYINTTHINNTTQNFRNNNISIANKIQTTQNNNNYNNFNLIKNIPKKLKKKNININISINNNNKIIYSKIYEYKSPLKNIPSSQLKKNSIPLKDSNHLNNPKNRNILKNMAVNNINNNINNKIKFLNVQAPKKKILNNNNNIIH